MSDPTGDSSPGQGTVQTLNGRPAPSPGLRRLEATWEIRLREDPNAIERIMDEIAALDPEERQRFLFRKRGRLVQARWGAIHGPVSRSNAYEWEHAVRLALTLHDLGLIDFNDRFRDRASGRRCKTLIRELGRLRWDWESEQARDWLGRNWPKAVSQGLASVKVWVREQASYRPNSEQ